MNLSELVKFYSVNMIDSVFYTYGQFRCLFILNKYEIAICFLKSNKLTDNKFFFLFPSGN